MQRQKSGELEWLEFDLLSDMPHVKHAVFLRHGGVSQGPYRSLNASYLVGDDPEHVTANRKIIENQLKQEMPKWRHMAAGRGCHGTYIEKVELDSAKEIINCDGLMTQERNVSLLMTHADCQVAIFYDPKHHAASLIHAGWRGSVQNIYEKAVRQMQAVFGSNPADMLVCISPSLGPDEAEFIHFRSELPEEFWHFQPRPTYFDFWAISEYQLQNAGVLAHHIEVAGLSTYANSYDFFSHRRDKMTGRHATCVTLQ